MLAEERRLKESAERAANWQRWGPYLAERQWGTVREDYSPDGDAWEFFPYGHARHRAYRWGEDGLLGLTDRECRLCLAPALWNERDPYLKERLFGLGGPQGNHAEDVKECYYYLDAAPSHAYLKALYKYPQAAFPYARLIEENARRGLDDPEFELEDTGVFDESRYFDVFLEAAKRAPNDLLVRLTAVNAGPDPAPLHLLPMVWFRNTWVWGCRHEGCWVKPRIERAEGDRLALTHVTLGTFFLAARMSAGGSEGRWLFTDNETNQARLFGVENPSPYVKDAFHERVCEGREEAVNPREFGTRVALWHRWTLDPGREVEVRLRLWHREEAPEGEALGEGFDEVFDARRRETNEFYAAREPGGLDEAGRAVRRQAFAGLMWTKQFYHYIVEDWLEGDPDMPPPPDERREGRNHDWPHLFNRDVISMPDKWEYPWYAAWDLAFHMIPFAEVDPHFARKQLVLFLREWYMRADGQLPAYEYNFNDVNPPVHAWACWRVYRIAARAEGRPDRHFLARAFKKLLINFTWWVNRKDPRGRHLFAGGFLGMDNIGVFDRSRPLPGGGHLEQADGTAWMAFYCLTMLSIALELARDDPASEDMASKFFEHFVAIADAMNALGGSGLWNEEDGFYYDQIMVDGKAIPLRVRSMVGLVPLIAGVSLHDGDLQDLGGFRKRMRWFLDNRKDLARHIAYMQKDCPEGGTAEHRLLAIPSEERLRRVLGYMLDENEFLSPWGLRSLSRVHRDNPFVFRLNGEETTVRYVPGDSDSWMFGGNSNWRGPVWFPLNYLLIEALEEYHHFYGDDFRIECPTGSGVEMNLRQVARELTARLVRVFLPGEDGRRPCFGGNRLYAEDARWRDLVLFHEYFNGDTGKGHGASHQTGWTALVARLIERLAAEDG